MLYNNWYYQLFFYSQGVVLVEDRGYFIVLQYVKQLIISGNLNIGDKLPTERYLSERLSLSRNTIRDAIRIMGSMGIVESRQGSGNYLSNKISHNISATINFMLLLEQSNFTEINQMRRAIALECFRHIFVKCTQRDIRLLSKIVEKMETDTRKSRYDKLFHDIFLRVSKNKLMISVMQALSDVCKDLIDNLFTMANPETKREIIDVHKEILQCIINRDEQAGFMAVNHHYDLVDKEILKWKAIL